MVITIKHIKTSSIYKKLTQFGLGIFLLIVLLNLWLSAHISGSDNYQQQAADAARTMARQAAGISAGFMQQGDLDTLQKIIDNLVSEAFIEDAMIYDKNGSAIIRSHLSQTATDRFNKSSEYLDKQQFPIVIDIFNDELRIGFLRVTYIERVAVGKAQEHHNNFMRQTLVLILLACLMGYLLTRAFSPFSARAYRES